MIITARGRTAERKVAKTNKEEKEESNKVPNISFKLSQNVPVQDVLKAHFQPSVFLEKKERKKE